VLARVQKTLIFVAHVSQADFTRAARGSTVLAGKGQEIEPILGGISSVSKCAVREVHRNSAEAAVAYFNGRTAKWLLQGGWAAATVKTYRVSLDQYIAWDGGSGGAESFDLGTKMPAILFAPNDSVRALAHVVRDLPEGREARVLLWDDLLLDQNSAELIALPIVERVENVYGTGSIARVEVWQLAQPQRLAVLPQTARSRQTDVQTLLAEL
jgi:hypothetical protein